MEAPPEPFRVLPTLDLKEVKKIFKAWGIQKKAKGHKFEIGFRSLGDMEGNAGLYEGRVGNQHFIKILNNLLFGDFIFEGKIFTLNAVAIHEFRHTYWNIIDPCKCRDIPIFPEFDLRNRCWMHNTSKEARIAQKLEEDDCDAAEEKYQEFKLFK